jgi:hypothetical protein
MTAITTSAPAFKNLVLASALAGSLVLAPAKSSAATTIFNLTENPETNFPTYTNPNGSLTLTIDDPVATNNQFPAAGGLNSAPTGFCAFAVVGTAGGRCYYMFGTIPTGNKFTGFTMNFSNTVALKSFQASLLRFVSSPSITFTSGSLSQTFTNFVEGATLTFPTTFIVDGGIDILVTTNGTPTSVNNDGVFRINNFTVTDVPGPYGFLGLAAAFRCSRKIRRTLKHSAAK